MQGTLTYEQFESAAGSFAAWWAARCPAQAPWSWVTRQQPVTGTVSGRLACRGLEGGCDVHGLCCCTSRGVYIISSWYILGSASTLPPSAQLHSAATPLLPQQQRPVHVPQHITHPLFR